MCVCVDEKQIEKDKERRRKKRKTDASVKVGGHKDGMRVREKIIITVCNEKGAS